jgi:Tfp pilus assembly PilM family ATPase
MFNFVQSWLAPDYSPIGVDFGTDCLRMAQVQFNAGEPRLIAAGSEDVPASIHGDPEARAKFFAGAARELLATRNFRGRRIMLGLPAGMTAMFSVSVSSTDENQARADIGDAVREKLGIDPEDALIREVLVRQPDLSRTDTRDVVLIAADRENVNQLIRAAKEAKLDIAGMNIEPGALIDCFSHVYRRESDLTSTTCFIDIGSSATRLLVAKAGQILSAATIAIAGRDFNAAVATAASISMEEARLRRLKLSYAQTELEEHRDKRELFIARPANPRADLEEQRKIVDHACGELLQKFIRQIEQFRERSNRHFPRNPIDRLVFVGGEAQSRAMCRTIARAMGLSALVGDPLIRMRHHSEVGFESGMDRREPQPAWGIAIGLSLGSPIDSRSDDVERLPGHPGRVRRLVHSMEKKR